MIDSGHVPKGKNSLRQLISFVVPPLASHVYASMGVARRLQALGHGVEYWGDAKIQKIVRCEGFGFRSLEGLWGMRPPELELPRDALCHPLVIVQNLRVRRRWKARLMTAMTQLGAAIDALLLERKPDLVIFDPFRLAYYPFVRRRGIAGVVLSTMALGTPDPGVPPHTSCLVPQPTALGRLRVRLAWLRVRLAEIGRRAVEKLAGCLGVYMYEDVVAMVGRLSAFDTRSERVRRGYGYDVHFKSVPEWVLGAPAMDFPRIKPLPPNIRYIGHCVDLGRIQAPLDVQRSPAARYLVYVAVGTAAGYDWQCDVPFLSKVVRAFADTSAIEVWISTGDERVTRALGTPAAHVRAFDFLPQLSVLDQADLAITHAGAGTLRECIVKEVPMLAYPRDYDQFGNSARIDYLGLGLRGDRREDSSAWIRGKAVQILQTDAYRQRVRTLKGRIETCESDPLADALNEVLPSVNPGNTSQ